MTSEENNVKIGSMFAKFGKDFNDEKAQEEIIKNNKKLLSNAVKEYEKAYQRIDALKAIYKLWRDLSVDYARYEDEADVWVLFKLVQVKRREGMCSFTAIFLSRMKGEGLINHPILEFHGTLLEQYLESNTFPFGKKDFYGRKQWSCQHTDPERIKWVDRVLSGEFDDFNIGMTK